MSFISASYSVKKLSDKRFTSENTALAAEAFQSPLDINASEIYTDFRFIPTSSNGLPFSGSTQNLLIVSASNTDSTIAEGSSDDKPILKYWYRKKVRRGNQGGRDTFFFVEDDGFGANDPVFNDQLITSSQQTNFISTKYMDDAGSVSNTTEDNPPGYNIQVRVGANAASSALVADTTYNFDYKQGILSFLPNQTPSAVNNTSNFVFITAYQYVGRTLNSQIVDGTLGGSAGFPFSGSAVITGSLIVSGATADDTVDFTDVAGGVSGSFSGSFSGDGSGLTGVVADSVDIQGLVSASSGVDNQIAIFKNGRYDIEGSSKLTFDGNTFEVDGDVKANQFIVDSTVTQVTMSFSSGSTIFGDDINDTHQMTGSLFVSGSISFSEIDGGTF